MSFITSPLRYPGGKSRALDLIVQHSPKQFAEFREPFLGGGSVFLRFRQLHPHARFWINDLNSELYAFWKQAQDNVTLLMEEVSRVKRDTEDGEALFYEWRDADTTPMTTLQRAVRFFVLNRISFSGTVESGGYSKAAFAGRFTWSAIERLQPLQRLLEGVRLTNDDYSAMLHEVGENVFIFLDPPYYSATSSKLYGRKGDLHTGFDHTRFVQELKTSPHSWLITYDDSPTIRENFAFAEQIEWELQYGMNNYKQGKAAKGKELFIRNVHSADTPLILQPRLL